MWRLHHMSGHELSKTMAMGAAKAKSNQELHGRVVSDVLDRLDILSAPSNKDVRIGTETSGTVLIPNTDETKVDSLSDENNTAKEIKVKRKAYKKRRTSAAIEGKRLRPRKKQALGIRNTGTHKSLQSKWDEMFDRLVEYKEKHGNCLVPNRYAEDKSLGAWVSTQRRQYKVLVSGSSSSTPMSPYRARRLNEIGFVWQTTDPRHTPWMGRYEQLVEFHKMYGHSLVPIGFSDNVQLANWVSTQRQEYKNFCDGKSGRINKKRIKLLNKIGFVWDAQRGNLKMDSRYREMLDEFCKSSSDDETVDTSTKKEDENDHIIEKKVSFCNEGSKVTVTANLAQKSGISENPNNPVVACPPNIPNQSNIPAALESSTLAMHVISFGGGLQHLLAPIAQLNNTVNSLLMRRLCLMQLHAATGSLLVDHGALLGSNPMLQNIHTNMLATGDLNMDLSSIMSVLPDGTFVSSVGAIQQSQMQGQLDRPNIEATQSKNPPQQGYGSKEVIG